jgi:hypothetical protein
MPASTTAGWEELREALDFLHEGEVLMLPGSPGGL